MLRVGGGGGEEADKRVDPPPREEALAEQRGVGTKLTGQGATGGRGRKGEGVPVFALVSGAALSRLNSRVFHPGAQPTHAPENPPLRVNTRRVMYIHPQSTYF